MVELRTARVDGGLVRFSITDSGPGIDPANLPHVFDAFYRADPARPRGGGGAGLGPAVVAAIARLHGGSARVANVPQGGARFEIDLAAHAA
jgi:signal transduction histidine kinase